MKLAIDKIVKMLGIDLADVNTIAFMGEDLMPLRDEIGLFVDYVRENCNSDKMRFKDGFQKFIFLVDEYKKNKLALSYDEHTKIYNYAEELNSKIIVIFELFNEELDKNRVSLNASDAKRYLDSDGVTKNLKDYLGEKGLMVVDMLGRRDICRSVRSNRYRLAEEIREAVTKLAKDKKAISLGLGNQTSRLINTTRDRGAAANEIRMCKRVGA
ncbi:MAG TPA: hypothetical protein EYP33_01700 [Pyrodictium sp.]|nr:hypothetical protein [Pyrodictium sp.]